MSVSVLNGTNDKPAASHALASVISSCDGITGQLFIGYPIVRSSEGPRPIDALLVSPDRGIVVFDLIESSDPGNYAARQADAANLLEARLKTHRKLMERRRLRIPVYTLSFTPSVLQDQTLHVADSDFLIVNGSALQAQMVNFTWDESDREQVYDAALSAIENISTIRTTGRRRKDTHSGSRGDKLRKLEDSIATMDHDQGRAVIQTVEGVQRIRGLAGSGKTIVLALKAAYLHVQNPDWRIAVTFHTRSLKGYFRRLISNFCVEQTGDEPDWSHIRIVNSWGSPHEGRDDGLYLEFCNTHDIEYLDFRAAKYYFGGGASAFAGACRRAIDRYHQFGSYRPVYDVILVDEAQNFPDEFLQVCYEMLRDSRRLVYAYDELQNLSGTAVSTPETMFGMDRDGRPKVQLDSDGSDIILKRCYRNSRPILVAAHAIGFGIYRQSGDGEDTGLIQMFDNPPLWKQIGYRVQEGELRDGSEVTLGRTDQTSPMFLESHSEIDDLVQFIRFDTKAKQNEWVAREIQQNLQNDEIHHDDIVVINPNPLTTRDEVGKIRARLLDLGISSHVAGVDASADEFRREDADSVIFTGVYRAKGNEAGMVYVINAQDCDGTGRNLASIRNRLFVAITRSKAWVRVAGVGSGMKNIMAEYRSVRNRNFQLCFTYPTAEQRGRLRLVHRDMTVSERKRLEKHRRDLGQLLTDVEANRVRMDDLDAEQLARLRSFLNG